MHVMLLPSSVSRLCSSFVQRTLQSLLRPTGNKHQSIMSTKSRRTITLHCREPFLFVCHIEVVFRLELRRGNECMRPRRDLRGAS